jgi:hypothetical protein
MNERPQIATEVAALEADERDRLEMREIAALMAELREPLPPDQPASAS